LLFAVVVLYGTVVSECVVLPSRCSRRPMTLGSLLAFSFDVSHAVAVRGISGTLLTAIPVALGSLLIAVVVSRDGGRYVSNPDAEEACLAMGEIVTPVRARTLIEVRGARAATRPAGCRCTGGAIGGW
jgi:hypothetical protein